MGFSHHLSGFSSSRSNRRMISTFLRDWGCCLLTAAVTAAIHYAPIYKIDSRIVPVYLGPSNGFTFPTEFLYPEKDVPVPSFMCSLLVILLPSLVIVLFQIKFISAWDIHVGTTGVVKAVVFAIIISEALKHFVGSFRPHYTEVCRPDLSLLMKLNESSNTTWWLSPAACTGEKSDMLEALRAFPSGNSAASFADRTFLSLYINAKFRLFSDPSPGVLGLAGLIMPLLLASLVSSSQYATHIGLP